MTIALIKYLNYLLILLFLLNPCVIAQDCISPSSLLKVNNKSSNKVNVSITNLYLKLIKKQEKQSLLIKQRKDNQFQYQNAQQQFIKSQENLFKKYKGNISIALMSSIGPVLALLGALLYRYSIYYYTLESSFIIQFLFMIGSMFAIAISVAIFITTMMPKLANKITLKLMPSLKTIKESSILEEKTQLKKEIATLSKDIIKIRNKIFYYFILKNNKLISCQNFHKDISFELKFLKKEQKETLDYAIKDERGLQYYIKGISDIEKINKNVLDIKLKHQAKNRLTNAPLIKLLAILKKNFHLSSQEALSLILSERAASKDVSYNKVLEKLLDKVFLNLSNNDIDLQQLRPKDTYLRYQNIQTTYRSALEVIQSA